MLEARALFYAMILSILIAMVSGLLIGLSYLHRLQQTDQFEEQRARQNVKSGISLLRREAAILPAQMIDLFGDQKDSVVLGRYPWGLYTIAYAAATYPFLSARDTFSKAFFLGEQRDRDFNGSLYLMDHNTPLALVGDTKINGPVFLPKAGVKRGYISGKGYTGTELIYGEIHQSKKSLPAIETQRIEQLYPFFSKEGMTEVPLNNIWQSFLDTTIYFGGTNIVLDEVRLSGNIIIVAQASIYVSKTAQLENVLLFAPNISFESGFSGQVQAFAREQINVGEGSRLSYPSILALLPNDAISEQRKVMEIETGSEISGMVLLYQQKKSRHEPILKIRENCIIEGQVWADGYVNLKGGTIHGNLTCKSFWLATQSSTYTNYLMDGVIDKTARSENWVNPVFTDKLKNGAIVQWVK